MVGGTWFNNDTLDIRFGTSNAVPTTAGDYLSYGETREIEFTVILANTAAGATSVVGNTTFIPTGVFIEQVEMDVETAAAGGTSFQIGTMRADKSTAVAAGAFINGEVLATITPAGKKVIYTAGVSAAGTSIGTTLSLSDPFAYITLTNTGTFTNGVMKIRIKYRGIGTITQ